MTVILKLLKNPQYIPINGNYSTKSLLFVEKMIYLKKTAYWKNSLWRISGEDGLMFCIGDMIAHPMHGAGIIDSIEERKMNGCTRMYYVLKMPTGGMVVMIPTESTEQIGVRPIVEASEADALMAAIPLIDAQMTANWNRRYRENMQRLKSGDLVEVARVVKGLTSRDVEKGLSTGERKMLHSAKQILISEIVLSKKLTYEEVETRLNAAMA